MANPIYPRPNQKKKNVRSKNQILEPMLCVAGRVHADIQYQVAAWFAYTKDRKKILEGSSDEEVFWIALFPHSQGFQTHTDCNRVLSVRDQNNT